MMITMHCQVLVQPQPTHRHHVPRNHHHHVPMYQVWPTQYEHAPLQTPTPYQQVPLQIPTQYQQVRINQMWQVPLQIPTQYQQVPMNQALVEKGSKRLEIVAPGPKGEAPKVKRGTSTGSPTDELAAQVDRQCVSDLCVMHRQFVNEERLSKENVGGVVQSIYKI